MNLQKYSTTDEFSKVTGDQDYHTKHKSHFYTIYTKNLKKT